MVEWFWYQEFVPANVIMLMPFGPQKDGGRALGTLSSLQQIESHLIVPHMVPAVVAPTDTCRKLIDKIS